MYEGKVEGCSGMERYEEGRDMQGEVAAPFEAEGMSSSLNS